MERLTTGRRHIRAGSVHVTELISKRPPIDLPNQRSAEADPADLAGPLDSLLEHGDAGPSSHRRPPSKGAQLAKIAGLGVGACVLCASVVLGSMITNHRHAGTAAQAGPRPVVDISGEEALLPDLLNQAVPSSGITGVPELPGAPTQATGQIENTGAPTGPATPPGGVPAAGPAATDDALSKTALVEKFYELVPSSPDQAFTLLDSTLLGTDVGEFVRSWTSVTEIKLLDVQPRGDDVLAVVRLRLPDGSYLRVQQLLDVANTVPRRITGAEILSAQRN